MTKMRHVSRMVAIVIAAVAAMALIGAACGSNGGDTATDAEGGSAPGQDSKAVGFIFVGPKDDFGYNAQTDKYENLLSHGVIDPVKVVRTALQNAASVASLMLTTECLVAERPKDEKAGGGGGHDHGGHGHGF